ncbi:MAG TPA: hypothetical protein VIZ61_00885 [Solirubrobacterales bacterium]
MSAASTLAPARPLTVPHRRIEPTIVEQENGSDRTERRTKKSGSAQCMEALARANKVRLARAALKRDISAGRRSIIEVIMESPWEVESMNLGELLCAQRRWGRARSRKLLSSTALSEGKRVGTLTERQRRILVAALEAKFASRLN